MAKETLASRLQKHGITITPDWNTGFIRQGSQWFTGRQGDFKGAQVQWAAFGDFARGISETWTSSEALSPEEQTRVNEFIKQAQAENRRAREAHWEAVAQEVEKEWASFREAGVLPPYAERKGFQGLYGCRVEGHDAGDRLIVPARDVDGKLWGYQRIYSEKLSIAGTDKIFRSGAKKEACFHALSPIKPDAPVLYLCEGISTAAAVFRAFDEDQPVISVFDAGNLGHVASALRAKYPGAHLVFCADNDQYPGKDGKHHHTGLKKAQQAAKAVGNARVVLPQFSPQELADRPTDFDDLARLRGVDEVKAQILAPAHGTGLRALVAYTATGIPTKPGERSVAMALLDYYGDNLLCQDQDLFIYRDGYWQHQGRDQVKRIKRELAHLYGPKAGIKDIESAYKYMLVHAPTPPEGRSLFTPQYWSANFQNGTLHFTPNPGGEPSLRFAPHSREDYHITQLPFEFPGMDKLSAKNPEFEKMLERIFSKDEDAPGKRRVLAQMFGVAMMPCYPKIFFLVGKKGSGKSTVMKLVSRLLAPRNISRVDPSHFSGFNMETTVGKLVNLVTDIDLQKPMSDSVIKQVTDLLPFRVSRKFQTDLEAPLPPVHIYGGNDLPNSMEGATGAYERRVVILTFQSFSAESLGAEFEIDFAEFVWRAGWQGILAFALQGLVDLVKSKGHFAVPKSSKDAMAEWDTISDPLQQFLDALAHRELDKGNQYKLHPEARISRKNLWECFASWQESHLLRHDTKSEKWFCGAMRKKGFAEYRTTSERGWIGIGDAPSPESAV